MGRIKTRLAKRLANELLEKHGNKFKTDFNMNKELVYNYTDMESKKIRDVTAGYVTRLVRARK